LNQAETRGRAEELADLRHYLRTPLNHIIGYSELILEAAGPANEEIVLHLRRVRGCAEQVLGSLQQLLTGDDNATLEAKTEALRRELDEPLKRIIASVGHLSQKLSGAALMDLLRINLACMELLSFAQGHISGKILPIPAPPAGFGENTKTAPARILIVDDDKAGRDMLVRQLAREGHSAAAAGNGGEALNLLVRSSFDLVLLDVVMPEMDGFQVLQQIRSSSLRDIPVIMISALDELEGAARCIEAGAEDYLFKPFDPILLRARLHSALERKRMREQEREHTNELEIAGQNLQRANEALNRFAFAASHDLQEPLRAVTTSLQLLSRQVKGQLTAEQNEWLGFAVDGARRMTHLISDLLAYSLAANQGRASESVPCESAFAEALTNLRQAIAESGAVVTHGRLPCVRADPAQLGQLFQNLIGNAIKYRGPETPAIQISAELDGNRWIVSVSDNGIGIDPLYSKTVFEPFQRLHSKRVPGTGLGLSICERIVESMGGTIWVDSKSGQGSTFRFTAEQAETESGSCGEPDTAV